MRRHRPGSVSSASRMEGKCKVRGREQSSAAFCSDEWTSMPNNRNIFFRNCTHIPEIPFSSMDDNHPESLWNWMDTQRKAGNTLLAISHNANVSDGWMYPMDLDSYGRPIDAAWAALRDRKTSAWSSLRGDGILLKRYRQQRSLWPDAGCVRQGCVLQEHQRHVRRHSKWGVDLRLPEHEHRARPAVEPDERHQSRRAREAAARKAYRVIQLQRRLLLQSLQLPD